MLRMRVGPLTMCRSTQRLMTTHLLYGKAGVIIQATCTSMTEQECLEERIAASQL